MVNNITKNLAIPRRTEGMGKEVRHLADCTARLKPCPDALKQKGSTAWWSLFNLNPGGDLLSHTVTSAVPSALEDFTSVFGMGTGVTPPVRPPGNFNPLFGGMNPPAPQTV